MNEIQAHVDLLIKLVGYLCKLKHDVVDSETCIFMTEKVGALIIDKHVEKYNINQIFNFILFQCWTNFDVLKIA